MAAYEAPERNEDRRRCPRCGSGPQLGCLRPEGDGARLSLVCSLCLEEWDFPRGACAACDNADEKSIGYYQSEEIAQMRTMSCDVCLRYLHLADFGKDPAIVPDVDEIAALPLDVWAAERGLRKIRLNLAGM
jgi:FdhE protein